MGWLKPTLIYSLTFAKELYKHWFFEISLPVGLYFNF
jgi:hypothetical protein